MKAERYDREPHLPFVCAECGDELVLTSSGHCFCANRSCRDGFDVGSDWQVAMVLDVLMEEKKLH